MRRRLHAEYARLYWHGYPDSFDTFLRLPLTDRYLANEQLSELITKSNEAGGERPKDQR